MMALVFIVRIPGLFVFNDHRHNNTKIAMPLITH